MAYIINRYNGTVLTTVEDGTVNQVTEVKFIGKNFAGYGEAQNENFLFLLENFAGANAPTRPISGMIWYDSNNAKIKVYDGSRWKTVSSAEVSTTQPTGLVEGELWWNNTGNQLYARNASNEWILVGPQGAGSGITQMQSLTLTDTNSNTNAVIAGTIEDEIIFLISSSEFTIASGSAITGFDDIKQGITLVNTTASTNGVTSTNHRFWGTASNALSLAGIPANQFLTTSDAEFTGIVSFGETGFTLGSDQDLIIKIDTDTTTPMIKLVRNNLRIYDSADTLVATIEDSGIYPGSDNLFELGAAARRWSNVYATTFTGTATQANTLNVAGTYRSASTAASPNTIAARDSSGDLTAVLFRGTATTARYADLAEKYTTKEELPAGTAVAVCNCDGHEVCPATASNMCIGVVSTDPAYMMNSDADGQYVGLTGRLPVRVTGPVKKGQAVYAMDSGVCTTIATTALVGIALESNSNNGEKLVECVLKV
jgi:hypothetical protein